VDIFSALSEAAQLLSIITDVPQLDAEILLCHILQVDRSYLRAHREQSLSPLIEQQFAALIQRRAQGEPIAYITGHAEFWSLDLKVTPDTLIPRPETELLVECVLREFPQPTGMAIADLGTGSGAIALALAAERPQWEIHAVDSSVKALAVAQQNAQQLNSKIAFHLGSWCHPLPRQHFNVIVTNPPYIAESEWAAYAGGLKFEPPQALLAGPDGLDAIRHIILMAKEYLKSSGRLFLEHGYQQSAAVQNLLKKAGYQQIRSFQDLAGHKRVTVGSL